MLEQFGDFLLSKWLWAFTFDWGHALISTLIMFFLLRMFSSGRIWHSLFVAIGSHLFALAVFSGIVVGLLIHVLHWEYNPIATGIKLTSNEVLRANISLAAIFIFFQTIFFQILHFFGQARVLPYFFVALISNAIASVVTYGGIWMMFGYLF